MKRFLYAVPLVGFIFLGIYLWNGLSKDPGVLPSALIDRPAPEFTLPPLAGREPAAALATADLATGKPMLVNFFASWCLPCRAEHPLVEALAREYGVTVHAINYKDKPQDAAAWLRALGDPYGKVGADSDGRVALEFGLYGVPETFVVDGKGKIRHRHAGALTAELVESTILPILAALQ
ncbi:MAG: DsbE family thiol:disulfide interchange protein [Alphaproteobacteria bacterium]